MQLLSATLSLNPSGRLYTWLIRNTADYPYVIFSLIGSPEGKHTNDEPYSIV